MDLSFLPAVNATLNSIAALLLIVGRRLAKRKQITAHRKVMVAAFIVSCLFLVCYVAHKVWMGGINKQFNASGLAHTAYLLMLATHILLAITVPVFAIVLIRLGLKGRHEAHKKLARWAWPIWMYVSVTGVLIYFILYHWNPPASP